MHLLDVVQCSTTSTLSVPLMFFGVVTCSFVVCELSHKAGIITCNRYCHIVLVGYNIFCAVFLIFILESCCCVYCGL
jgi:hypothetical protein